MTQSGVERLASEQSCAQPEAKPLPRQQREVGRNTLCQSSVSTPVKCWWARHLGSRT